MGERLIAFNRPAAEDDPLMIEREQIDAALAGTNYTFFEQAGQGHDAPSSRDVWQAFLIAMLVFLLAEAWLCLPKRAALVEQPASAPIPS